jgi:hypothetical protein
MATNRPILRAIPPFVALFGQIPCDGDIFEQITEYVAKIVVALVTRSAPGPSAADLDDAGQRLKDKGMQGVKPRRIESLLRMDLQHSARTTANWGRRSEARGTIYAQ